MSKKLKTKLANLFSLKNRINVCLKHIIVTVAIGVLVLIPVAAGGEEVVRIEFLHAMSGGRLTVLKDVIGTFNEREAAIHVELVFGGKYAETATKAISRWTAGTPPHIAQIEAAFNRDFIDAPEAMVPVYKLFAPYTEVSINWDSIIEPIRSYYSIEGNMWSFPFNSSTSMLYYNKDMYKAAGLDPNKPPRTFAELEEHARKLLDAGVSEMGITSTWPTWSILENMIPYHAQWFSDNENGHTGLPTEVYFTGDFVLGLMGYLSRWAQEGLFTYLGREYAAVPAFVTGRSAFLFLSTSTLASVNRSAEFEVGTAFLPRLEGYPSGRSTIGGATLYVFQEFSDREYEAIATFLKYLLETETIMKWHKGTGYFPVTNEALQRLHYEGWFAEDPNFLTALLAQLTGPRVPQATSPLLGNFVEIRDLLDIYIEEIVTGRLTPEEAMRRANEEVERVLKDYAQVAR